jgi:MFS family permease
VTELSLPRSEPWYRSLDRAQWNALLGSNLGWLFDGYETYALVLVVGGALRQLLDPAEYARIPAYAGTVIALTLLGWAIGGLLGGILADYFGRKRVMIFAILGYSILTGLSAFAWDWTSFAAMRFVVGLAIGSEWVTGTSIIAEFFPDRARGRGVGLFQCGFGVGFFLAAFVFMFVSGVGPGAWRWMFVIGVLPALLTLWVRRAIPESGLWVRSDAQRRAAAERKRRGAGTSASDEALTRFTLVDLFAEPEIRRRTILAFLVSLATTFCYWGISTWVPPFIGAAAQARGLPAPLWISYAGMAFNLGAIVGYVGLGFLADAIGRKPTTMIYLAMSLVLTPVLFLWTQDLALLLVVAGLLGCFAAGQFTWMSAWLPELYPTRMRATGAGFGFNGPRLLAWAGPLVSGALIVSFGGYGHAATMVATIYLLGLAAAPFLPETRGKPLPETV